MTMPRDRNPQGTPRVSSGMLLAIAVGVFSVLAIMWFTFGNRPSTGVNSPAFERSVPDSGPKKTNMMPGKDQNIPNPTPPAQPR